MTTVSFKTFPLLEKKKNTCEKLEINILVIASANENLFETTMTCDSIKDGTLQEYPYGIDINRKSFDELLDEEMILRLIEYFGTNTNGICDGFLIYALPDTQQNVRDLVVFIQSIQAYIKNVRLYLDLKNIVKNFPSQSRLAILEHCGLPSDLLPSNIRVINSFPYIKDKTLSWWAAADEKKLFGINFEERNKRFEIDIGPKVYDCIVLNDSTSKYMTCKPWFIWYLNRAFTCLQGRLLQYSGTCYLNSVLNGFILSDFGLYLANVIMPILYPNFQKLFQNPLSACLNTSMATDVQFIFHVLYQTRCFKQSFAKKKPTDFIGDFAKTRLLKTGRAVPLTLQEIYRREAPVREKLYYIWDRYARVGQGGFSEDVFVDFMKAIAEALAEKVQDPDNYFTFTQASTAEASGLDVSKFIVVYELGSLIDIVSVPTSYTHSVCFVLIGIDFPGAGHAVCGFICEGQKAIFDSNGHVEILDWSDNAILQEYALRLAKRLGFDSVIRLETFYVYLANWILPQLNSSFCSSSSHIDEDEEGMTMKEV